MKTAERPVIDDLADILHAAHRRLDAYGITRPYVRTVADAAGPGFRVHCTCGASFHARTDVTARTNLGRHTWRAHDRWPTDTERATLEATT